MSTSRADKKSILGDLNIDFDNFDAKDSEGKYLFSPPNVVSIRRMSVYLKNWTGPEITSVVADLTIFDNVPLTCKGHNCSFSKSCALVERNIVDRWIGKACVLDQIQAFRLFAGYVNDLEIKPEDFTDLGLVNDLVRLQIQLGWADKLIREESPVETMVIGTDKKTDLIHKQRQPSQLIVLQKSLRTDIASTLKQLLATRQSKLDASTKQISKQTGSELMAEILKQHKLEQEVKITPGSHLEL